MHIVEKEARKTPKRLPMAWGYLKTESTCGVPEEMNDREVMAAGLLAKKTWKMPTSHLRPLKMETIHRPMNFSDGYSM